MYVLVCVCVYVCAEEEEEEEEEEGGGFRRTGNDLKLLHSSNLELQN